MVFDQDDRSIINFKGNNVYFETLNSNTITVSQKLTVHDSVDVTNTLTLESLKIQNSNKSVILKAPTVVDSSGDPTYILPNNSGADGKYLRYENGGSGTLVWAQLDSDKIYSDNATISIANSTISMSTSGAERFSILDNGDVLIGTPTYNRAGARRSKLHIYDNSEATEIFLEKKEPIIDQVL